MKKIFYFFLVLMIDTYSIFCCMDVNAVRRKNFFNALFSTNEPNYIGLLPKELRQELFNFFYSKIICLQCAQNNQTIYLVPEELPIHNLIHANIASRLKEIHSCY